MTLGKQRRLMAEEYADAAEKGDAGRARRVSAGLPRGIWRDDLEFFARKAGGAKSEESLRLLSVMADRPGGQRVAKGEELEREILKEAWRRGNLTAAEWAIKRLAGRRVKDVAKLPELGEGASEDEAARLVGLWPAAAHGAWLAVMTALAEERVRAEEIGEKERKIRGMAAAREAAKLGDGRIAAMLATGVPWKIAEKKEAWAASTEMKRLLNAKVELWNRETGSGYWGKMTAAERAAEGSEGFAIQATEMMGDDNFWRAAGNMTRKMARRRGAERLAKYFERTNMPIYLREDCLRELLLEASTEGREATDDLIRGLGEAGRGLSALALTTPKGRWGIRIREEGEALEKAKSWDEAWEGRAGEETVEEIAGAVMITREKAENIPDWVWRNERFATRIEQATLAAETGWEQEKKKRMKI